MLPDIINRPKQLTSFRDLEQGAFFTFPDSGGALYLKTDPREAMVFSSGYFGDPQFSIISVDYNRPILPSRVRIEVQS
jgi:hypothetical protein